MEFEYQRHADVVDTREEEEHLLGLDELEIQLEEALQAELVVLADVRRIREQIDQVRDGIEERMDEAEVAQELVAQVGVSANNVRWFTGVSGGSGRGHVLGATDGNVIYMDEALKKRKNKKKGAEVLDHEKTHPRYPMQDFGLQNLPTDVREETGLSRIPEDVERALCEELDLPELLDVYFIEGYVQQDTLRRHPGGFSLYEKMEVPAVARLEELGLLHFDGMSFENLILTDTDLFLVRLIQLGEMLAAETDGIEQNTTTFAEEVQVALAA